MAYVNSKVAPQSNDTLWVEFGFNIFAINVGNKLDFRRSDRDFSFVGSQLEINSTLCVEGLVGYL